MPDFDLDAALTPAPRPDGVKVPECVACGFPTEMQGYDSVHEGYRTDCVCPHCDQCQWDFWQVTSCQDHGDGAPNLLLDGPEGEQTNDVERYRQEAFCPSCDGGDEHIQNLTWAQEWVPCEQDGALLEDAEDYTSPWRCTWVECRACLFGWKEIYTLTGTNRDDGEEGNDA